VSAAKASPFTSLESVARALADARDDRGESLSGGQNPRRVWLKVAAIYFEVATLRAELEALRASLRARL
jgi:hypothetical protein